MDLGLAGTSAQLEHLVTTYRRISSPKPEPEDPVQGTGEQGDESDGSDGSNARPGDARAGDPQWRARSLTARANDDRTVTIVLRLPTSEALEFLGALEPFTPKPDPFDPAADPIAARRADAAVDAIRTAAGASTAMLRRPLTTVRVDLDVLGAYVADSAPVASSPRREPTDHEARRDDGVSPGGAGHGPEHPDGCCEMSAASTALDGPIGISMATVLRVLCDCDVETLAERAGRPQGVSNKRGLVTGRLRKLVLARDRHRCRFPGCSRPIGLDVHHLQHRARGGSSALSNLMVVCRFHHHQLHEGGWTVAHTSSGLEFRGPRGVVLTDVPPVPEGDAGPVDQEGRSAKDGRSQWQGDRLDLGMAIDIIQWSERRTARWPDPDRWDDDPHHAVHIAGQALQPPV